MPAISITVGIKYAAYYMPAITFSLGTKYACNLGKDGETVIAGIFGPHRDRYCRHNWSSSRYMYLWLINYESQYILLTMSYGRQGFSRRNCFFKVRKIVVQSRSRFITTGKQKYDKSTKWRKRKLLEKMFQQAVSDYHELHWFVAKQALAAILFNYVW